MEVGDPEEKSKSIIEEKVVKNRWRADEKQNTDDTDAKDGRGF